MLGDDETSVLTTLVDGSCFGEISILNLGGVNNRRTATVRSVGYSYLFSLAKRDLLEVLTEYPVAKQRLEERGRNILIKDGLLTREEAVREENRPRTAVRRSSRGGGVVVSSVPFDDRAVGRGTSRDLEEEVRALSESLKRLRSEFNTSQMKLKQRIFLLEKKAAMATV